MTDMTDLVYELLHSTVSTVTLQSRPEYPDNVNPKNPSPIRMIKIYPCDKGRKRSQGAVLPVTLPEVRPYCEIPTVRKGGWIWIGFLLCM